ncbi:MAG: AI-2E family transporter [Lachnospiraceae bacterium]|nr:AI-2E family transporter [Lachnospiraceae bacterium]
MSEKKKNIQTILGIITFTVILIYLLNHLGIIFSLLGGLVSLLTPFLLGCAIAFIINIPMSGIEAALFKNENGGLYKFKRIISMIITYILAILVVGLVIFVVVPEVASTVDTIRLKLPGMIDEIIGWVQRYSEKYPDITSQITKEISNIEIKWEQLGAMFKDNGTTILTKTFSIFSSIISGVVNTFIGLVFSMYILVEKEKLGKQAKMICYSAFKEGTADELLVFGKLAATTFAKFFTGQFREGIILGTMFAVVMAIIGLPYPVTIGVLIAFTALIPIFGAFIGLFIGAFLILIESPKLVIWFVVLFFVLQFIENYFIYPKLVGGDIGLSAIWVLLAVLVGGNLMGVVGMFIFIPLVSVIYAYVRSIVYRKLKKKSIDVDSKSVPDDAVPLMEGRRRMFARKAKEKQKESQQNEKKENDEEK